MHHMFPYINFTTSTTSAPPALLSVTGLIVTSLNAPHLAKACALMVVVEVEIVTLAKELAFFESTPIDAGHRRRNVSAC